MAFPLSNSTILSSFRSRFQGEGPDHILRRGYHIELGAREKAVSPWVVFPWLCWLVPVALLAGFHGFLVGYPWTCLFVSCAGLEAVVWYFLEPNCGLLFGGTFQLLFGGFWAAVWWLLFGGFWAAVWRVFWPSIFLF
ncbi:hypothetical protein IEQ34_005201 [Dendrobium chrysotoxum]|uniref:Uncharacterized protein n=1 Tax=Dendrobium chrysotoxum TaxID=161865 RepID=A0AAV7HBZ5_DENCH|nr:hypothetical protein IEQ34_005201 [Dendrobium chrysotoxum]